MYNCDFSFTFCSSQLINGCCKDRTENFWLFGKPHCSLLLIQHFDQTWKNKSMKRNTLGICKRNVSENSDFSSSGFKCD